MKAYIGKYVNWIGPYQIADMLKYIGVPESRREKIGKYLSETKLENLCNWVYSKRQRKIKIKIHDYDYWNADETLSLIILPIIKKLRENRHGVFVVDDEDVPEELRICGEVDEDRSYDNLEARYNYVMSEIIWAFEEHLKDDSTDKFYHYPEEGMKMEFVDIGEGLSTIKTNLKFFDEEGFNEYEKRLSRGFILFGKYFRSMWD